MQDTCTPGTYISTICQPAVTFVVVLYYAENDSRVILVAQSRGKKTDDATNQGLFDAL